MIAFDWASLPKGSTVVDVGGGIGGACMVLAKHLSAQNTNLDVQLVIQDRAETVQNGLEVWKRELPHFIESGSVTLQGQTIITFCYLPRSICNSDQHTTFSSPS